MFKALLKILPILSFVTSVILWSCEGRKSKNDLLQESISKYNDDLVPVNIIKYYPEAYTEIVKDSILSNGFKVKIKTFTNMDKSITKVSKSHTTKFKDHFRKIESDVVVYKNDKLIFKETINNEFLMNHLGTSEDLKNYIGNDIYINEEATLNTNKLVLIASLYKPKNNNCISYNIIIDEHGVCTMNKINYART
ncbi:hypothetical protein [Seonamhaeicola maritimus]|uniref:DUF4738 domain-containing protein n=1 Tax=Seonamhaeicola maritimus TaxID=2591822 RepID=A0A5C7GFT2_9FLAO|nr:hypothetical protein [Seonamhaeicola maritimus]TXG35973.1 hypothetical protein FUA22_13685 [Seonamhaeicola maritimus]